MHIFRISCLTRIFAKHKIFKIFAPTQGYGECICIEKHSAVPVMIVEKRGKIQQICNACKGQDLCTHILHPNSDFQIFKFTIANKWSMLHGCQFFLFIQNCNFLAYPIQ